MKDARNIPAIRFKEFSEAWEQRKVRDLLTERNQQSPMCEEYPLMAFIANIGIAPKGERYDRSSLVLDAENKKYKRTELGDFIYSSNNLETGSIGLNKYGKACISPVYSVFMTTEIADSDFIGRRFAQNDFINAMVRWRQGVIYGQWKIHESDFLNIDIIVPSIKEQRRIGAFLDHIDTLITLHQRKIDALKTLKKALLAAMFPDNGSDKPLLRFKGFNDAWEQRRLGECAEFNPRADLPDTFEYVDLESVEGTEIVSHRTESKNTAPSRAQRLAHLGDLFYQTVRPYQRNNVLFTNASGVYVFSTGYAQLRPYNDGAFLLALVQRDDFVKRVMDNCTGTGYPAINSNDLAAIQVQIPLSQREAKKIGVVFSKIDSLITLHQRKLEGLKTMKTFLLQNMFI